jgi:hypothetical protein
MEQINCQYKGISVCTFKAIAHSVQCSSLNREGVACKL